eukprot:GHUV01055632.1.p1 GENE.GHUV01055632.1~~GHUV01055632.1.p1  ORF type:complete len:165 (-),score=37.47 GHUV01055632.1:282-776(-)
MAGSCSGETGLEQGFIAQHMQPDYTALVTSGMWSSSHDSHMHRTEAALNALQALRWLDSRDHRSALKHLLHIVIVGDHASPTCIPVCTACCCFVVITLRLSRWLLLLCAADVAGKFASSAWGKKLAARSSKAAMTDFDRYKAAIEKSRRNRAIRKAFNQLKKSA